MLSGLAASAFKSMVSGSPRGSGWGSRPVLALRKEASPNRIWHTRGTLPGQHEDAGVPLQLMVIRLGRPICMFRLAQRTASCSHTRVSSEKLMMLSPRLHSSCGFGHTRALSL